MRQICLPRTSAPSLMSQETSCRFGFCSVGSRHGLGPLTETLEPSPRRHKRTTLHPIFDEVPAGQRHAEPSPPNVHRFLCPLLASSLTARLCSSRTIDVQYRDRAELEMLQQVGISASPDAEHGWLSSDEASGLAALRYRDVQLVETSEMERAHR